MTQKQIAVTGDVPIRRTTEIEEITNLHLIHPLASRLVPIFARLHVTPNAVSIVGMLFGILSAFAYYRYWDPRFAVAGFALMVAWHVMDGADGQLARYTQSYSYFGKMLDGIADHVTFVAVYAALAVTSSRRHGNWVYLLVAISAVFHAIQSASYETERQEYEYLGWGKKPQDPPPRNSEPRDRGGPGGIRWALDFLNRLFFFGLSFPTTRINRKFRETMAEALQNDPGKAVLLRQHYREILAPQIRSWSVLSANYRTLGIFISTLFKAPEYYFGFEIVGFSVILAMLIRRLNSAHEVLLTNLRFHHGGVVLAFALLTLGTARPVHAQATAYLPLNLEPEMERQVERVLILADEPILKRPYSVELVKLALPQACRVDPVLCRRVRRYLERYSRDYAVTHASITGSYTHNGAGDVVPDEHGLPENSHYDLSIAAFVQPTDYLLASAGGISYRGRTVPTGSMLTLGTHWAQIDVGWRDHWLSPLTDTSALISTEAPTTPSITLSNWEPMTRLGFQYEFFLTKLSSQPILYNGVEQEGHPRLFGSQFSIEPFPGWSVGINRMLEFGGGSDLPGSARFVLRQFFKPSGLSQTQGNQQASYVTRFVSPTRVPFALYFQYAGEDTELGGAFLLGSPMMSGGIDFPRVLRHFDVTYEISEWSNLWYIHNIFLYGMSQNQLVLGAWGAEQRNFGDGLGARSQMVRVGWSPPFGGYLEEKVRLLTNQEYFGAYDREYEPGRTAYPYHHYLDASVRYTRPWKGLTLGGEAEGGHDVFGKNFVRLSGFVRYGGDSRTRDEVDDDTEDEHETSAATPPQGAEWFVDIGGNVNRVITAMAPLLSQASRPDFGAHFALGGRRAVSDHNDFGARVEYDEGVDGHYLIGFRALDWRYRFDNPLALGVFVGAERYSAITPATSLYAGVGVQWRDIWRHWDLDLDGRYGDNLARDHVLASDFRGTRPETFYRIQSLALYLSRHF